MLVRSWRLAALAGLGALGGGLVGFAAHRVASGLLGRALRPGPAGHRRRPRRACLGAAAGVGFGLATRRLVGGAAAPRGRRRLATVAATALACALAGFLVSAAGGRLGAVSLDAIVAGFPSTRVRLDALGRLFGEEGLGPRTRAGLGFGEGLLFGAGLAAGLTRRPRRPGRRLSSHRLLIPPSPVRQVRPAPPAHLEGRPGVAGGRVSMEGSGFVGRAARGGRGARRAPGRDRLRGGRRAGAGPDDGGRRRSST